MSTTSPTWTPELKRAALDFIEELEEAAANEDAPQPHVLLIVDPEVLPDYKGPVIGPYPDRATAEEAAKAKAEELNRGNNDTPFEVYVVRFFPT